MSIDRKGIVNVDTSESAGILSFLCPIKKSELGRFIPVAVLMMLALYNFAALRSIKDGLIVPEIGAEAISFLKLWLVLPSALVFTVLYMKLSNHFSLHKIFCIIIGSFAAFLVIFGLFIFPYENVLHLSSDRADSLVESYPHFQWFIRIIEKWSYSLMYIVAELWSTIVINLMFWQFVNSVTDAQDAKRIYPLYGFIGNIGILMAGQALVYFTDNHHTFTRIAGGGIVVSILSTAICCVLLIIVMMYINKMPEFKSTQQEAKHENKTKLSIMDSLRLLLSSKYIMHMTVIVLCYSLAINVVEGPWKDSIRKLHPSRDEYVKFMGYFNTWLGVICIIFTIIGSNVMRVMSWLGAALITPLMLGITGLAFFVFIVFGGDIVNYTFNDSISYQHSMLFNPIFIAVIAGAIQGILSKACKYSLFDPTKEMTYIGLDVEIQSKGKATVEVIGAKAGKSLGAAVQSLVFSIFPEASFSNITSILMVVFVITIALWISNTVSLSKEYARFAN